MGSRYESPTEIRDMHLEESNSCSVDWTTVRRKQGGRPGASGGESKVTDAMLIFVKVDGGGTVALQVTRSKTIEEVEWTAQPHYDDTGCDDPMEENLRWASAVFKIKHGAV